MRVGVWVKIIVLLCLVRTLLKRGLCAFFAQSPTRMKSIGYSNVAFNSCIWFFFVLFPPAYFLPLVSCQHQLRKFYTSSNHPDNVAQHFTHNDLSLFPLPLSPYLSPLPSPPPHLSTISITFYPDSCEMRWTPVSRMAEKLNSRCKSSNIKPRLCDAITGISLSSKLFVCQVG